MNLGASSHPFFYLSPYEALRRLEELDFELWEVLLEGRHALKDYSKLKEMASSFNVTLLLHAPFSDLNIASLDSGIWQETLDRIQTSLEVADFLGVSFLSIHAGRLSPMGNVFPEAAHERNVTGVRKLCDLGAEMGVDIYLENQPAYPGVIFSNVNEIERMLDEIGRENLGFTFDIGHANTCGDVREYIRSLGKKIKHVHVHDNDGSADMHEGVGKGNIDFPATIRLLKKAGYNGAVIMECKTEADLLESVERLSELL